MHCYIMPTKTLVFDGRNVIYLKLLFFVVHIDLILSFPKSIKNKYCETWHYDIVNSIYANQNLLMNNQGFLQESFRIFTLRIKKDFQGFDYSGSCSVCGPSCNEPHRFQGSC